MCATLTIFDSHCTPPNKPLQAILIVQFRRAMILTRTQSQGWNRLVLSPLVNGYIPVSFYLKMDISEHYRWVARRTRAVMNGSKVRVRKRPTFPRKKNVKLSSVEILRWPMSAPDVAINYEKDRRDLVKDLADAVSTQAEVANRTWLALITVAIFALIPHVSLKDISLPFSLGDVSPSWFQGVVFSLLVVLAIAFASAHSQQVRAQQLAQAVISSLGSTLGPMCDIHPRDYFDMLRKPSLSRIASLAQSLRGKYQFFTTATGLPVWWLRLTVAFYALWKIIVMAIYFVFPIVALLQAHRNFSGTGLLHACNLFFTWVAVFALGQVMLQDLYYAVTICKHLLKQVH